MSVKNRGSINNIPTKTTGIYGIKSITKNIWYIGQSIRTKERILKHLCELRAKKHYNLHLQRHFDKYGESDFHFFLLVECGEGQLSYHETNLIREYDAYKNGFNQVATGEQNSRNEEVYAEVHGSLVFNRKSISDKAIAKKITYKEMEDILVSQGFVKTSINTNFIHNIPELKQIKDPSGKILSFYFYESFCDFFDLNSNLVRKLIDGRINYYKKWVRFNDDLKNYSTFQTVKLIDPFGKPVFPINLTQFEKENGLPRTSLQNVWLGFTEEYLGWRPFKEESIGVIATKRDAVEIVYKFVSPDLEIHETNSLTEFASKHSLTDDGLSKLWKESVHSHKGWRKFIKDKVYKKIRNGDLKIIGPNGEILVGKSFGILAKKAKVNRDKIKRLFRDDPSLISKDGWRRYEEGKTYDKFEKHIYKFIDPDGKVVEGETIVGIAKENKLNKVGLLMVWNGSYSHHRGWRKFQDNLIGTKAVIKNAPKIYKFLAPNGEKYETSSISTLAKQHGLRAEVLCKLWNNHTKTSKEGWRKFDESLIGVKFQPKQICPSLIQ